MVGEMARLALVIGTSTGIGRATALHLAERDREGAGRPQTAFPLRLRPRGAAQALLARLLPDRAFDVLVARALKPPR